jgi:hypothetical protein
MKEQEEKPSNGATALGCLRLIIGFIAIIAALYVFL